MKEKLELSEELSNNRIHEKASKFTDFLNDLSISCEVCDRNPEPYRLPGHRGGIEFRKKLKKIFGI